MDHIDKQLLNFMQHDFPLVSRPYEALGAQVGVSEAEALSRVQALLDEDVIRKIGPSFNTSKLDHASALVAVRVPSDRLEEVAGIVSSYPEVTHNYGRDFDYNLWFTVIASSREEVEAIVEEIKARTGVSEIYILPATKLFKISVKFDV